MKALLMAIGMTALASTPALAETNCTGIPQATKVGEYGAQEGYLIVTLNNMDFRLGPANDSGAKARLAVVTAALAANKQVMLRFFEYGDCAGASAARAVPNSTQILQ
ncbi:hypothetical protein CDN99_05585 [Roseateles aquatilis]|uniref:Uncharacterized protein n=1 Tax=Roseateles aquatilis TaxID=431061 RepID=A0A246JGW1_9BURK|nr:hypothetical protein [Roseateles aquatilis]OWQ91844.1 hypothetical protein CDN99_05585 [Roseateles aquatilis]